MLRLDAEDIQSVQQGLNDFLQVALIENELDRQTDGVLTLVELLDLWAEAARKLRLDSKIIDDVKRRLLAKRRGEPPATP